MQAADIMTKVVISVAADTTVPDIAKLMLDRGISSVTVVDRTGRLIGLITEGDLLRRAEMGTERRPSRWLEVVSTNAELAADYVKSHARKAADIMTRDVITASAETPVRDIVDLMESRRIKRVPIVHDGAVIGIVSRANLVQALLVGARFEARDLKGDRAMREALLAELKGQAWVTATGLNVIVSDGMIHLWGTVQSPEQRSALRIAAENVPGARGVEDHLVSVPALPAV
ncbi:MAG TPA: CBS domain-containing protein [Candidatus Sulfotelmatobacter sp.]|nr:CBS domain-containing protein [Candidatus Sulfotelmatobacter sp.]